MNERDSDQQLVERVQKGDKRAFDLLVKKYQHRVIALVGRFVRDRDEALDVTQDAFIKAYRALHNFRGDSAFYTWIYRIAINTAKNYLVSQGRRPSGIDLDLDDVERLAEAADLRDLGSPENLAMRDELEKAVFQAMKELPEDLRMA
ncbi:MAG TPA: sigma-70 family RNA polymerase sigma factor, partial [Pseudomonadales bacterium]|nr:sigma-70 family RNA polymerase sigma factor [Pseudomonadales bacterium]